MELFWVGFLIGAFASYLAFRIRAGRPVPEPGAVPSVADLFPGGTPTPAAANGTPSSRRSYRRVLVGVMIGVALVTLAVSWDQVADLGVGEGRRLILFLQRVMLPFVIGIALGVAIFGIGERLLTAKSETLKLAELGGVGVILLLAVLVAKDPHLRIFDHLKRASISGFEFELPSVASDWTPEYRQSPGETAPTSNASHMDLALNLLVDFENYLDRDRRNLTGNPIPELKPLSETETEIERDFVTSVLVPTFGWIATRHDVKRIASVSRDIDIELAEAFRRLANGEDRPDVQLAAFDFFQAKLRRKWRYLCGAEELFDDPLQEARCRSSRAGVLDALKRIKERANTSARAIFPQSRAYGVTASALILHLMREDDAALADLDKWITRQYAQFAAWRRPGAKPGPGFDPYQLFRAIAIQQIILVARQSTPQDVHLILKSAQRGLTVADALFSQEAWRLKSNWVVTFSKENRTMRGLLATPAPCHAETDVEYRKALGSYMSLANTFAFSAADPRIDHSQWIAEARRRIDEVVTIDPRCIEAGYGKLLLAAHDTRTSVYLRSAHLARDDQAKAAAWACEALTSAEMARDLLGEFQKSEISSPGMGAGGTLADQDFAAAGPLERSTLVQRNMDEAKSAVSRSTKEPCEKSILKR